jgi:putative redox protein
MKKAVARQTNDFTHRVEIRQHEFTVDEPEDKGGHDEGPTPQELLAASLASCTAITLEMYAKAKRWEIGPVEVACEYTPAERGQPTTFKIVLKFPDACTDEQVEKLEVIAAKCPVHRTLAGEVQFEQEVERAR